MSNPYETNDYQAVTSFRPYELPVDKIMDLWTMKQKVNMPLYELKKFMDDRLMWGDVERKEDDSWKDQLSKLFEEKVKQINQQSCSNS